METSLHRQLKALYAAGDARLEVPLDDYRIDVVADGRLVEIQHGKLAAIRDKIGRLLVRHHVTVVKPLIVRKTLVRLDGPGGTVLSQRLSPRRSQPLDLFHELVYFTRVFPHPRLTLEAPLVEIEERRYPGHGRRRRWRRSDHEIEDQQLIAVERTLRLVDRHDLLSLIPGALPLRFDSAAIARIASVPRWVAQRVVYCLRKMGATREVGKVGNTRQYAIRGLE
jgi:hypothetical protein